MKDAYGRNITYARLSITDLCNLRCQYCMPADGIEKKPHGSILTIEQLIMVSEALASLGVEKIRITGGEPLVRKGILTLVEGIAAIEGVRDIAITTNATLLAKVAGKLRRAGVNRINISLDTMDREKFRHITRCGELDDVMAGIRAALDTGFDKVKVNAVLMKGFNDDEIENFVALTLRYPIDVRFIEIMQIGDMVDWSGSRYLPVTTVLERCPELRPIEYGDPFASASHYALPDAKGAVGLIAPISCGFCDRCNRIRITADGKVKHCLHSDEEFDLVPALGDREKMKQVILKAVEMKPERHKLTEQQTIRRNMMDIGG